MLPCPWFPDQTFSIFKTNIFRHQKRSTSVLSIPFNLVVYTAGGSNYEYHQHSFFLCPWLPDLLSVFKTNIFRNQKRSTPIMSTPFSLLVYTVGGSNYHHDSFFFFGFQDKYFLMSINFSLMVYTAGELNYHQLHSFFILGP